MRAVLLVLVLWLASAVALVATAPAAIAALDMRAQYDIHSRQTFCSPGANKCWLQQGVKPHQLLPDSGINPAAVPQSHRRDARALRRQMERANPVATIAYLDQRDCRTCPWKVVAWTRIRTEVHRTAGGRP